MTFPNSQFLFSAFIALSMLIGTSCSSNRSCSKTLTGATIGAVAGAVLDEDGGVGGAIAGGVIGGAVGAAADHKAKLTTRTNSPYYYPSTPAPAPTYAPAHKYPSSTNSR